MSGMSDIVFLLLIFFMITSTLIVPAAQNVELPESNNQTQSNPVLVVSIDINKTIYVDDQAYALGELEGVLQKKLENYGKTSFAHILFPLERKAVSLAFFPSIGKSSNSSIGYMGT